MLKGEERRELGASSHRDLGRDVKEPWEKRTFSRGPSGAGRGAGREGESEFPGMWARMPVSEPFLKGAAAGDEVSRQQPVAIKPGVCAKGKK